MKALAMVTLVKSTDYLTGYFRQNEVLLSKDEREAALVKGWDLVAIEGGSDTVFHYRIPAALAPQGIEKWAFSAVEFDCTGATGRTWVNGQSGPVDADVTFLCVDAKQVGLEVIKKEAERRATEATAQSEQYKKQRTALTTLEAKVKERLQSGQPSATSDKK